MTGRDAPRGQRSASARGAAAALVAALALLPTAPAGAERGVTETEIVIGTSASFSGPLAYVGEQLTRFGLDVYLRALNDAGGIHGRTVRTVYYDDGYRPASAAANTRRLVEQDGVFAVLLPQGPRTLAAIVDYLEQQGVPLLFPFQGSPVARGRRLVFSGMMLDDRQARIVVDYLVGQRRYRRFALIYQDDEVGRSWRALVAGDLGRHRLRLVAVEAVTPDATDAGSLLGRIRRARPEVTLLALVPLAASRVLRARQQAGWVDTVVVAVGLLADERFLALDGAEGVEGLTLWPDPLASDLPGVRRYREHLHRYFPKHEPNRYSLAGYLGGMLFAEAARRAGPDLTRPGLVAALEGLRGFDSGILPPLSVGPDHETQKQAVWVRLEQGRFRPLTDWRKAE